MQVFSVLLPQPLTQQERQRFEQMHLGQPHFGMLPFVLIAERFSLLRSILFTLSEYGPDPRAVAVMHHLLDYYSYMAMKRRAADRAIHALQRRGGQGYHCEVSLNTDFAREDPRIEKQGIGPGDFATAGGVPELFTRIAERVCREVGVRCECPEPSWDHRMDAQGEEVVVFSHYCTECGSQTSTTTSMADLQRIGKELQTTEFADD
jgi:hypothetical protein